jgi:putative hydrolase of the HAD superfamily
MTVLLFDFFGTLVDYSPSRTRQDFRRSHALVPELTYEEFLASVDATFAEFDRRSDLDDSEFSMHAVAAALLSAAGAAVDPEVFERVYIAEWQAAVTVPAGLQGLIKDLRTRHRLAIVSNTHSQTMVPGYLAAWGVTDLFDTVVLSVDVGRRKPHPLIYRTALDRLGIAAADAVFVGDSYPADYLGPSALGIASFLIDPGARADVPADRRLGSVFDLPARLA